MKRSTLVTLSLSMLAGIALGGEAQKVSTLTPLFDGPCKTAPFTPKADATAEVAVGYGNIFAGKLEDSTRERMARIWNLGEPHKRFQALHEWAQEIADGAPADDGDVAAVIGCMKSWCKGHVCDVEVEMMYRHLLRQCQNDQPIDTPRLRYLLDNLRAYCKVGPGTWLNVLCSVNGDTPESLKQQFPMTTALMHSPLDTFVRLWNDPEGNAGFIEANLSQWEKAALHCITHDFEAFAQDARRQGIEHWGKTIGSKLPEAVAVELDAMLAMRNGTDMRKGDALDAIDKAAASMPAEQLGFIPRCKLAVDPEATVWKSLDDKEASLFLMPDVSAVHGSLCWNDKFFFGPQTTLEQDVKALADLVQAGKAEGSLPALVAFILKEAEAALPEGYWREHMGVLGYDTFLSYVEVDMTEAGVDIVITNDGPRFSKNDAILRAKARALELALHRIILKLALAEKNHQELQVEGLADVLNKYGLWPLLLNQYELRGISPRVLGGLLGCYASKPELLGAILHTTGYGLAWDMAVDTKTGKADMQKALRFFHEMTRSAVDGTAFALAGEEHLPELLLYISRQIGVGDGDMEKTLRELQEKNPELAAKCVQGKYSYTGWRILGVHETIRKYILGAKAEMSDFEKWILEAMLQDPATLSTPAGRFALYDLALRDGDTAKAERLKKDAVILAAWAISRGGDEADMAWELLLHYNLVDEAERISVTVPDCMDADTAARFSRAAQEKHNYTQAAFLTERALLMACKSSTPTQRNLSHMEVAALRRDAAYLHHKSVTEQASAKAPTDSPRQGVRYLTKADMQVPAFKSDVYTWHVISGTPGQPDTVLKGRIETAYYESQDARKCWLNIVTEDGKHVELRLSQLRAEDIDNLIAWKELNSFVTCMRQGNNYVAIEGKPVEWGVPCLSPKDEDNWYVIFRLPHGKPLKVLFQHMTPESREQFKPLFKDPAPQELKVCRTWTEAKRYAESTGKDAYIYFMGKRGGSCDKALDAILANPLCVADLNASQAIVLSYMDEAGNWDEAGKQAMDECIQMGQADKSRVGKPGTMIRLRFGQNASSMPEIYDNYYLMSM